jgi:glycosyltransferase involved in cell wall biosynthesis
MKKSKGLTIGVDATNLRRGGGLTHLVELLEATRPEYYGIDRIVIWGGTQSLKMVKNQSWLSKYSPSALDRGLFSRMFWQRFHLSRCARDEGCDLLFVPGGSFSGDFRPVVTMSQNLLPFEVDELIRYGWSWLTLKLLLLRLTQAHTFRKANGVIFLTKYALDIVSKEIGNLSAHSCIIPHGLNLRFFTPPKIQRNIFSCNDSDPFRIIYVSIVDQYKHQWHVVEAISALRSENFPIVLDLIGPSYPPSLQRLNEAISKHDPDRLWVNYHGAIPFEDLHIQYSKADIGLFASSCENMPNILLETMASGLPIACSNRGPMSEILGDAGIYFNPEQPNEIIRSLRELIESPELRQKKAAMSFRLANSYSWRRCASETFDFLVKIIQLRQKG